MFKLSVSNIAWTEEYDQRIYSLMKSMGFEGVEIAPTRIFPEDPYEHRNEARVWSERLFEDYGLIVSSIQSIWYRRTENIFGSDSEREVLIDYTKQAIKFAEAVKCKNLVFGCPRNRKIHEGMDDEIALQFFKLLGDYAYKHNTIIGLEANPTVYNTNYINTTKEAMNLIA